jgi:hypothetical protein
VQKEITKNIAIWLTGSILLIWPLVWNGSVVLFNDTVPYLMDGRQVWSTIARAAHVTHKAGPAAGVSETAAGAVAVPGKAHKPLGGRSPYYGAFAWGGRLLGGLDVAAAVQAAWLAGMILGAWRLLGVPQARWRLAGVAVLAAATSLGFFAATIMPDVFAGAIPLSICVIWFCRSRMSPWSRAFWWLSLTASMLFHTAYLLTGIALVGCLTVVYARKLHVFAPSLILCATALCIAFVGTAAISTVTLRLTGAKVTPVPFLLARTIDDGTAAKVLKQDCPQVRYATCRYVKDLPLSSEDFLWNDPKSTPWVDLPADERAAIAGEQNTIVFKALTRYSVEQLAKSAANGIAQLGALSLSGFERNQDLELEVRGTELSSDMARFRTSPVWTTPATLRVMAGFWKTLYFVAAVLAIVGLAARKGPAVRLGPDTRQVLAWLLVGVVISALENGVLSGVFGRYGARISWLPMFALCTLAYAAIAQRNPGRATEVLQGAS